MLRLQEEARRRQIEIDASTVRIDRVIDAERLELAAQAFEKAVEQFGEFTED